MRILADENITLVRESFAPYGDVITVPGRSIDIATVRDCDALLVRSVTPVTAALLEGSRCRFVATATSGIDHIDVQGLQRAGIALAWAQGCNSLSVVDYVFSVLAALTPVAGRHWRDTSIGIIGCGRIGSLLARRLLQLGMAVKIHDPFLPASHPLAACFTTLEEVLRQQAITLHVPLTREGPYPTRHMLGTAQLVQIPHESLLINAARGSAIDNAALLQWLQERPDQRVVLDTWEGEPAVGQGLLARVTLGTPHIAGYSREGKLAGTRMIQAEFCAHFGLPLPGNAEDPDAGPALQVSGEAGWQSALDSLILQAYDVRRDHAAMQALRRDPQASAGFDRLRKQYPERHEFTHYRVEGRGLPARTAQDAAVLGFRPVQSWR